MEYVESNERGWNVKILCYRKKSGISVARGATFYAFLHKKCSGGRRGVAFSRIFFAFLNMDSAWKP